MDLHNFNNNIHSNMTLPSATTTPATSTYFTYSIPGMDITPGPVAFTYISEFLSLITPAELPLDLVRQFLHSNLTLIDFTKDAIKIESGFIALMSIFAILALVPLISTCAWCCGRRSDQDEADFIRNAPVNIHDDSLQQALNCRKSASVVTLWITFLLLALSDFCIFYANSRLAANVEMTPEMVKSTVHDMEVFLKDTHLQIKHKLDNGFHVAVEKVVKDLEDVDVLLGEPIQAEISAHTGIELAYDSLATISLANAELIYRVLMLQETVGRALKISQEAAARMEELQIQLSVLQRQCTYRDRPLCDTLRIRSFEENGIIDALKTLQEDQTIFRMRYLGEIEFGATVKNLTSEVGVSRSIFSNFPQQVKHDTAYERNYTLEQLESIRHRTKANAQMLTSTINALLERLQGVWPTLEPSYEELQSWSNSYWTAGWVAALVIGWVLLFGLMSYCCFLCESNVKAGVVLLMSVLIICLGSICITFYGVLTLAIGGNTEVFLCRSMYDATTMATANAGTTGTAGNWGNNQLADVSDASSYHLLGKLFDKPGYVYAHEPQTGIIGELLRPEGVNRSIVNVSLATALRGCEQNQASYNVFQLDAFVNTTQIADLKQFPKVTTAIDAITVSERTMLSLTQTIQNILENMLHTSSFNLTTYRVSIGAPTPEKDLATFIDQMQRVALQIQDVATSSRMTTLGSRSKRLQASILQPLEQLQNEILYHLTALELQRDPWAKQVNQTLNHLRNVQGYLEKTAGEICSNQTRVYTERLKAYLTNSKATMSSQLGDTTAKCRPFFDIFDANRIFLCRNIVDYINALWFCIFITLLLWSVGTPVGLNLITIQRRINRLRRAQARSAERSDSRSRRRERTTSSAAREPRSASSASRPPLRRTATEETLDIATEESPPPRREQRDVRSRDREMSRARESVAASTPARSRTQQRRTGTDAEDNWGSSSASRATSMEREPSQPRMYTSSSSAQQQRGTQARPQLRKQGTEEFDLEAEDNWQPAPTASSSAATRSESRAGVRREQREQPAYSHSNGRNKPKLRRTEREKYERPTRRSMTPVLQASPDAQQARPMPRTPTRLRHRVTLTTRAVTNLMRAGNPRHKRLQRSGTEDFEIDESETYGAPAQDSAAVAAARRTPPRTAPPPPPPPGMMNRYGSVRSVRWNAEEDMVFEDVESPNPIYMNHHHMR
ncbi:prominin-2 isoform X1 [Zeugodacus cucurbitae]|uniref:prominin-2 isoform X1 n=1 Tax=Zeugodacus cucurbitae TaxID=28588 RepID=UPI0023D8E6DD|nr:prominin-2 isoform X1 [Zeugodacus cucurbitae]XP_054089765.1 prominin-2 isoform X1 [Zeugodacus cucurbitae]